MRHRRIANRNWLTFAVGLGLLIAVAPSRAQSNESEDNELPNLTAQWWQFVLSIPNSVNPGLDPTGAGCGLGQRGPLWFLVGTFSSGAATRACSIPEGEALFFPVVNEVNINVPNQCGQGASQSVDVLRSQIAPFLDAATNLSVHVDGQRVGGLSRVKSEAFAVTLPADNLFAGCAGPGTVLPAATYSPAVDDGFYVLLKPLNVGSHTLHIHGEIPSLKFVVDVTYNLTVVPVRLK